MAKAASENGSLPDLASHHQTRDLSYRAAGCLSNALSSESFWPSAPTGDGGAWCGKMLCRFAHLAGAGAPVSCRCNGEGGLEGIERSSGVDVADSIIAFAEASLGRPRKKVRG